jgi:hypothetical protein
MPGVLQAFAQSNVWLDVAARAVGEDGEVDGGFLIVTQ